MPVAFMEGFDAYGAVSDGVIGLDNNKWRLNTTVSYSLIAGRVGGQALRATGGTSSLRSAERSLENNTDTLTFGIALRNTISGSWPGNRFLVRFLVGIGTQQFWVGIDTSEQLIIGTGALSSPLATSGMVLSDATWHYIEVELFVDGAAGFCRVFQDGQLVINFSGDTQATGSAGVDALSVYNRGVEGNNAPAVDIDDMYFVTDEAQRLGDCRVILLPPTSDTAQADFSPSEGSDNFAMVDDVPSSSGDLTFVESVDQGAIDLYGFDPVEARLAIVHAVQTSFVAKRPNTGERALRSRVSLDGQVLSGRTIALSEELRFRSDVFPLDPSGEAWNLNTVAELEAGMEVVDGG